MGRTKLTDYKLEATLMDLIGAGTTAGFNQGVNFIDAVDMDVAKVAAVAPTAAPAGLAAPALALPAAPTVASALALLAAPALALPAAPTVVPIGLAAPAEGNT